MRTVIIAFGLMILCLLVLFRIAEVNYVNGSVKLEVIVAIAAVLFFFIGLYVNNRSSLKEKKESQKPQGNELDYGEIRKSGLTQREHDVLVKMAQGLSNQEIATALYVSESTVKTHVSNIFFKLNVKRRTQAIQVAKEKNMVI